MLSIKGEDSLKKTVALLLCLVTVALALSGCVKKEDPGTEMNVYMNRPTTFDPAVAYSDQASAQFLSFLYQGLFTLNSKGELKNAMCKKYTVKDNVIEFTLNDTCWSDGTRVDADDYVYAWKRLLNPEFQSEAASLLFYIKNAKEVKNGDEPIDNLCLYASGNSIIRVELVDASLVDKFIYNTASVALFPLREDIVNKISVTEPFYDSKTNPDTGESILKGNEFLTTYSWSTLSTVMVSCGPFYAKRVAFYPDSGNATVILERNKYYYRDTGETSDDPLQKEVVPFRVNIEFSTILDMSEAGTEAYGRYTSGTLSELNNLPMLYNSNLPLANRTKDDSVRDLHATYTYFFNVKNPMFEKSEVRNALSAVLDREKIASIAVYGKAATGLVTDGVFYTTRKTSFREKAGNVMGASMTVDQAKSVIAASSAETGAIKLSVRDNESEIAIAEYVKSVWEQLGYTVEIEVLKIRSMKYYQVVGKKKDTEEYDVQSVYDGLTRDLYLEKYQSGEFDVIGVQYSMMSTDPFASLSQFAAKFSGNAYDFTESAESFEEVTHITGYDSEAYNKLMADYFETSDDDKRAEILVEAEKLLMKDLPVSPLYFMQSGSVSNARLKNVTYTYDGFVNFTKATDSEYKYTVEAAAVILPKKIRYSVV